MIPSSATSTNVGYVEGVDHIRGFAAFLVVTHHAFWVAMAILRPPLLGTEGYWPRLSNPLLAPMVESHIALCVFFVLSGFILTLACYGRDISYGAYLRNRCLRVFPVYFLLLFFGIALYPRQFDLLKFIASATIFSNQVRGGINLHPITAAFWTVGVEFQFYLVFPFLVAILARQGRRPFVFAIGLMIALRGVGHAMTHDIVQINYWHLIPGRLDQFLIGMMAAQLYMRWQEDPRADAFGPPSRLAAGLVHALRQRDRPFMALALALTFGWLFAINRLGGYPQQTYLKALTPTLEALVCALGILAYLAFVRRLPAFLKRAFALAGDLSLSTYLCHFTVIGLFMGQPGHLELWPTHLVRVDGLGTEATALLNVALALAMTAALALLFFRGVEEPFMRLRTRYVRGPGEA